MEILLGWYETQEQEVFVTHSTRDGDDYYECWETKTIQTSPYGYKRTEEFKTKEEAEKWCDENSTKNSHYFIWEIPFEDEKKVIEKYEKEKWYYD